MLQRKLRWINVYLQVPIGITDRVLQEIKNAYVERNVSRHEGNFIKKNEVPKEFRLFLS